MKRRRSARPRRRPSLDQEPLLNALRQHARHLATLGGLLEACGACPRSEPVEVALVAGTGELVLHEARELLELLAAAEHASLRA